ncbi:hypothetical protein ACVWZ6_009194 [Bradyrhizobium sp. GM6.1]
MMMSINGVTNMNQTHRGYSITNENGRYVAQSADGDNIAIHSVYRRRVQYAIEAFWTVLNNIRSLRDVDQSAIDRLPAPRWLREWLANPTSHIDLDAAYARGAC